MLSSNIMKFAQSHEKQVPALEERRAQQNNRGRNQNIAQNEKNKETKFNGACLYYNTPVYKEKDCWKKHFAKSGAAILDTILVTSIVDFNVPTKIKHVFRFKK